MLKLEDFEEKSIDFSFENLNDSWQVVVFNSWQLIKRLVYFCVLKFV